MKLVKKICIWGFSALVLAVVSGFTLVYIYEDEVKSYALNEIAKALKTDVNVSSVDLTLIDQFPSASLQFNDVLIEETFSEKDTLIFAKSLYLNFGILDIIRGNYEVNEIAISNSELNLKRKKNGEDNYHFWKESESEEAHFLINIDQVKLSESNISFDDQASETNLKLTANNCQINAIITDENLDISGDIDTQVHRLDVSEQSYLEEKSVKGKATLNVNLSSNLYTFSETELKVNNLPLEVSGQMDLSQSTTKLNLTTKTRNSQLDHLVLALPSFVSNGLLGYSTSGGFNCNLSITGKAGGGFIPDFTGSYVLSDATIKNSSSGVSLEDIHIQGNYSAPFKKEDLLTISKFSCALGNDEITGSGKISRLSSPFINVETQGNIDLENLNDLFGFKEIEELEGRAKVELRYKGNLGKNWQPSAQNLRHADLSGKVNVENCLLKLHYNEHEIEDISGSLVFNKGEAEVSELKGTLETSDFAFNGKFTNVLSYLLLPDEQLKVNSSLVSNHIDLNTLLSSSGSEANEDYEFNLPDNIDLTLKTQVNDIQFREFRAKNITTQANLNSQSLKLKRLNMMLADGEVKGEFSALQRANGTFSLSSNGTVNRVDISNLFVNFEDFHQDFITHKHIKGTATSEFAFSASMTSGLDLVSESISADADITLYNGELVNHSTLKEIGQYIKDKKLLGALMNVNEFQNKLSHVKFSELTNQIQIRNSTISIPKMSIESDALNILAEGNHSFDNDINYSVGFDLADLTRRDGLAEDEKGMTKNIFISMTGNTDNPIFNYDRLAVKEQRQENRKQEVHKIRELVRKEFSGKQEEKKEPPKEKKKPKIQIDWSEEDEEQKDKKKPKKIILSQPDSEPEKEVDEDDDF